MDYFNHPTRSCENLNVRIPVNFLVLGHKSKEANIISLPQLFIILNSEIVAFHLKQIQNFSSDATNNIAT